MNLGAIIRKLVFDYPQISRTGTPSSDVVYCHSQNTRFGVNLTILQGIASAYSKRHGQSGLYQKFSRLVKERQRKHDDLFSTDAKCTYGLIILFHNMQKGFASAKHVSTCHHQIRLMPMTFVTKEGK